MRTDNELYKRLRALSCEALWNDAVAAFDRATPRERMGQVAVIRAVGAVFSTCGTAAERARARSWLRGLLDDPNEKVRRYAIAALPKFGADPGGEAELLALLPTAASEREKQALCRALAKVGGAATLEAVAGGPGPLAHAEQKVKAGLARKEEPSRVLMDRVFSPVAGVRIHLRCRKGLEAIVRDEAEDAAARGGKLRVAEIASGLVAVAADAPFSLSDLYALRCFDTAGFVLGTVPGSKPAESVEAFAAAIVSPFARELMRAFTEGSIRYRLQFFSAGPQRGAVRCVVNRAYALCPEILNDPRKAPWAIDVHPSGEGFSVELRPRITPDPRRLYRLHDVRAASHPPLAACMARLAGAFEDAVVWDPFCGSGVELIERALLGGAGGVCGTDLDPDAVAAAEANWAAAGLKAVRSRFACADFRRFVERGDIAPGSVALIITNPPMGRRVRVPDLRGLIEDLFAAAARVLRPGGRLVFANPTHAVPRDRSLRLEHRQVVDLGGFDCRLEKYVRTGG